MKDNKDIEKMLREIAKQTPDYPEKLKRKQRNRLIRLLFVNKYFWILVLGLIIIILCVLYPNLLP